MYYYLERQIGGEMTIQKLPASVLLEILKYLPIRDRCRARRVCKTWNQIVPGFSYWRHVDLLGQRIDLRKIVRNHLSPHLLTLKIRGYVYADDSNRGTARHFDALLKKLSACCPKLQLLHLNEYETSDIPFESLPTSITCLEVVYNKWRPRWMKDKQMHLPNLVHLSLDKSVLVDDRDLKDVVVWKNLKYLSLKGCYSVGIPGVKTIAGHLSELEFLNLGDVCLSDLAVHHITQHLKKLKELCIANCASITDKAIASIAVGLPVLNKLDISYCEQVTMSGLESLFLSKLSVLIVECWPSLSEEEKQTLKNGFSENVVLVA